MTTAVENTLAETQTEQQETQAKTPQQKFNGTLAFTIGQELQQSLPTYEELQQKIRERAYELWEAAECPWGQEDHFWSQAEQELFNKNDSDRQGYDIYVRDAEDADNETAWTAQTILPICEETCGEPECESGCKNQSSK